MPSPRVSQNVERVVKKGASAKSESLIVGK